MDIEKTIELIGMRLEQMAAQEEQLTGHHERMAAHHEQLSAEVRRIAQFQLELTQEQTRQQETINLVISAVGQLRDHAEHTDQRLRELAEGTDQRFREVAEGFRELRESEQQTRENLNALIKVVDDLIRRDGRRNKS